MSDSQSTTFSLIHSFLVAQGLTKPAKALKKALKKEIQPHDPGIPSLDEIVSNWLASQPAKPEQSESSEAGSSNSSSSSESDGDTPPVKPAKKTSDSPKKSHKRDRAEDVENTPEEKFGGAEQPDQSESEHQKPAKKRRLSEPGPRKNNTPFQRIKVDDVQFYDPRLQDNSFDSRGATNDDYGARASKDLIVTRGAGFRKEKNKKKRGSYRGGDITMESHSIKFNLDD